MNYERAIEKYFELKDSSEKIEAEAKKLAAPLKNAMKELEGLISQGLQVEGLENAPTTFGTAYFTTHYSCSVADQGAFFEHIQKTERWDLMEKRASKSAVKLEVEETGEVPPGVNFGSVRVLNIRRGNK